MKADHPRIRGEHKHGPYRGTYSTGSSPHTRGAPGVGVAQFAVSLDHPRIRGEHLVRSIDVSCAKGSSPHTRGAPPRFGVLGEAARIIPAYAGSTRRSSPRGVPRRDHPRIRGEHPTPRSATKPDSGSSPHTRGAPHARRRHAPARRIIPAYAGSTMVRDSMRRLRSDHPRIRGEHRLDRLGIDSPGGSSPHTRGAHAFN